METIFALLLLLVFGFLLFMRQTYQLGGQIEEPWFWNTADPALLPRTTRNMSYDIRGDPYIPFRPVSPWNNPEVLPIRNRQLYLF